ncbi:MAG: alkaline phosphatase family protein, partial [Sphingobium sp.]
MAQPPITSNPPSPAPVPAPTARPTPPQLIVAIAVDQFSAELFAQYRSTYTGGLARLATQGVV